MNNDQFAALQSLIEEPDFTQGFEPSKVPLSDAPMVWGEYNLYRECHATLAFCALMVSQLKSDRFTDSVTQTRLGSLRMFRPDHDPVATQTMWSFIALWDNHNRGFPGPLKWTFRETDKVETFSKKFDMNAIRRIIEVSKLLYRDADAVLFDLERNDVGTECASFLLSHTTGMPEHLTLWESKVWCRHATHQAEELREACEIILSDRKSRYDEYIANGVRITRDDREFEVCENLGDYFLISENVDEVISL